MTYYRVKEDRDVYRARYGYYFPFIKGELFTEKNLAHMGFRKEWSNFERVEIPKSRIFFLFGKRFSD